MQGSPLSLSLLGIITSNTETLLFDSVAEGSLLFYEAGTRYSTSRQLAAVLAPQIKALKFQFTIRYFSTFQDSTNKPKGFNFRDWIVFEQFEKMLQFGWHAGDF